MLRFAEYMNNSLSETDKEFIKDIIDHLRNPDSCISNIQYLYNNSDHFTTTMNGISTENDIKELLKKIDSKNQTLIVQGNIHSNYHISNVLIDCYSMYPLFVKDTYIRLKDVNNRVYHVLLTSPEITTENYMIKVSESSHDIRYIIPPSINASI